MNLQQESNIDTVEAYQQSNMELDSRNYSIAAFILQSFALESFTLLTNNPRKVAVLESEGFVVTQRPLVLAPNAHLLWYFLTKREKLEHLLPRYVEEEGRDPVI